ncbi:UNKNOWN [Stylonychia lemnae]|uniref:Kelch motif family protein n=1 Tax=Stylonychia lemnae TaxID=5949 RepID=A0A078BB38_STYLE|nr:UNKNOWN [Stylonychia lemnae]|eukprot:CDW90778.1 UNKNOWN [Stylonychia lemnae]
MESFGDDDNLLITNNYEEDYIKINGKQKKNQIQQSFQSISQLNNVSSQNRRVYIKKDRKTQVQETPKSITQQLKQSYQSYQNISSSGINLFNENFLQEFGYLNKIKYYNEITSPNQNLVKQKKSNKKKREQKSIRKTAVSAKPSIMKYNYSQLEKQSQNFSGSIQPTLTELEMKMGLFYFKNPKTLQMVHLDPKSPKYLREEELFQNYKDLFKVQEGFAFINVELMNHKNELELRHLVFGLRKGCQVIQEFDRDDDTEYTCFKFDKDRKFNWHSSMVVFDGNQLIITGGESDRELTIETLKFILKINKQNKRIEIRQDVSFPKLIQKRSRHNSFIHKDYLFVMFGNVLTIEFLNLRSQNAYFQQIDIDNTYDILKPIVFMQEEDYPDKVFIFGGSQYKRFKNEREALLIEMKITFIQQQENSLFVEFDTRLSIQYKSPVFEQNMPNKCYYKDQDTWLFLDEKGQLYKYEDMLGNLARIKSGNEKKQSIDCSLLQFL